MADIKRHVIDTSRLVAGFPTQCHSSEFWEALGRCVATFGFLEETLGKAIFSFTATRHYDESEVKAAYAAWLPTLQKALSDQLSALIRSYKDAVEKHQEEKPDGFSDLVADLKQAATLRNVICHGSWSMPDAEGRSLPKFVNKQGEVWDVPMDVAYLNQLQGAVARLISHVINTVTFLGWQFPGSVGPGIPIWPK